MNLIVHWNDLNLFIAFGFCVLGALVVLGVVLQAKAIVNQSKSFLGTFLKMGSLGLLVALVIQVKSNAIPYIVIFAVSAVVFLLAASLARQRLLR
jgi:hypothetical protein